MLSRLGVALSFSEESDLCVLSRYSLFLGSLSLGRSPHILKSRITVIGIRGFSSPLDFLDSHLFSRDLPHPSGCQPSTVFTLNFEIRANPPLSIILKFSLCPLYSRNHSTSPYLTPSNLTLPFQLRAILPIS